MTTVLSGELGTGRASAPGHTQASITHGPLSLSAEQKRGGKIYFLLCSPGGCLGRIKIGWTSRPEKRLAALDTVCPFPLRLLAIIPGRKLDEKKLHSLFGSLRRNGEWFDADERLVSFINRVARDGVLPFEHGVVEPAARGPIREELARLIRQAVEPCRANERAADQISRAANILSLSYGQAWRMWHGRGAPKLLPKVKFKMGLEP